MKMKQVQWKPILFARIDGIEYNYFGLIVITGWTCCNIILKKLLG